MAMCKTIAFALLLAYAEARFGQEQEPVAAVQALGDAGFGDPGAAATIAGSIPGSLLAAASPCDKLTIADKMITDLGTDQQVLDAAIGLVAAETNFNPFAVNKPFVCADASLPVTAALRGIVPLVDPAVTGSDTENANSATSKTTPFDAQGLSQAEVMIAQGFSNFTAVGADGQQVQLQGQDGAAGGQGGAGSGAGADAGSGAGAGNGGAAAPSNGTVPDGQNGGQAGNGTDNAQDGGNADNNQDDGNDQDDDDCNDGSDNGNADDGAADGGQNNQDGNAGNNNGANNGQQDNQDGQNNQDGQQNQDGQDNGNGQGNEDGQQNQDGQDNQDGADQNGGAAGDNGVADGGNAGNDGNANNGGNAGDNAGNGGNAGNGTADGNTGNLDFGVCQPTMAFIGGLNGRPADEFTFIPQDALVAEGQQEALNPNIITNRICDQLTNVCDASDEAKAACESAKAEIESLGTRDKSTADTWNALLGFAGVDSSQEQV
ncbi:hypothetical protein NW762_004199 [Fusarium torreyae]|uniref:Circumsporozoite protein n=1 Tax=Fusarium torreyae TaxID=1237075 RepID=A0A9W8S7C6_9HYPO|nr:hypothetical protein NW762_004199 [Fusarium torreyae]